MRIHLAVGLLLILTACASRPPIRGTGVADAADLLNFAVSSEAYERVQDKSVEPHPRYTVSFVEFDAHGRPARDGQIESAEDSIRRVRDKGVVVLFVHGWGHSADARDSHVAGFRDALSRLEQALPGRTVVGIYVGWPARWLRGWLHYLTFWDRSRAAQQISRATKVRDVLRDFRSVVEEQRGAGTDIVSVAVGHSLGGKFLFTPMEERLEGDTNEPLPESPQDLPLFGDLVLLINPAQDIHDFNAFERYSNSLPPGTRPTALIFSSEADGVVARTFRIGRTVRNIVTPWNWAHFRSESIGLGWDPEQVTHTLCLTEATARSGRVCDPELWPPPFEVTKYGPTELRRYSPRKGPFPLVRLDGDIIKDHSDIFNDTFLEFLRVFVARTVVSKAAPTSAEKP